MLDDDCSNISLLSEDGQKFSLPRGAGCISKLVEAIVEGGDGEAEIPLPSVKGHVLQKIVSYLCHHENNPPSEIQKPLKSTNMRDIASPFDADFVEVDQELLFDLVLAANFMDIQGLLDLTSAKIASMIKGRSVEQIRTTFNIENDFSPEEEEAVRLENRWAFVDSTPVQAEEVPAAPFAA
mmetsp:Transcript_34997/g.68730  ORF Transcript_34997/g.68730 Transcript_34997/m.68730 type:complete len:181 (-) Transcript_34997:256-798(-)|eukprot:CAMPEP_0175092058 /NCGR_PEP_ID=MMETSP0086_2-20121207/2252_1 /TAXON_ID=136419 /ORGANISM="Unknown Unknown, Strain D1" /LENGTH=180 /DNA_ID=CAMNT_0016364879 /DNA_START=104 /DNA_END=646 /DNA_ORIENTATION=+